MDGDGDIGVSRHGLECGQLREMIAKSGWSHLLLDDCQMEASLAKVRPPASACWVFAYGSLMWNPLFDPVERRPGILHGYHRRFCFWIHAGRATPEAPGLMMGLLPGGTCRGMLLRIPPEACDCELRLLWKREMVTGAYIPSLRPVRTPEGVVNALVFLANPRHPTFAGNLALDDVAHAIAKAAGPLGRNRDYLRRTVETLRHQGIPDRGLEKLAREIGAA
jgi:cation transport protein ChaC